MSQRTKKYLFSVGQPISVLIRLDLAQLCQSNLNFWGKLCKNWLIWSKIEFHPLKSALHKLNVCHYWKFGSSLFYMKQSKCENIKLFLSIQKCEIKNRNVFLLIIYVSFRSHLRFFLKKHGIHTNCIQTLLHFCISILLSAWERTHHWHCHSSKSWK